MPDTFDGPVAVGERRALPATDDASGAPARELAQRRSGDVAVLLLWHPESVHIDVAPDKALDAFDHPYAYVSQ